MNEISHKTEDQVKEFILAVEESEASDNLYSNKVHKKIAKVIKNINLNATISCLSKNHLNMIIILNRLSFTNFCKLHSYIDNQYPGISFHYVMESRIAIMNYNKTTPTNYTRYNKTLSLDECEVFEINEYKIYLSRFILLEKNNMLGLLFGPMRVRLIRGLLNDYIERSNILEQSSKLEVLTEDKFIKILQNFLDELLSNIK